jgi:hypothetical protein
LAKSSLLAGIASCALVASCAAARAEDTAAALRRDIEAMADRFSKIEAERTERSATRRAAAAAAVETGDKPRSWKLPGTTTAINIGGFVKLNVLWDFAVARTTTGTTTTENIGAGGTSVTEGSQPDNTFNGGHFEFSARRSRLWAQTWTPTDWGELRTYLEMDFIGSGADAGPSTSLLRLRQAYGILGPVLVGKTQTLFFGRIGYPEVLDDGGPIKPGNRRIEQIRYSHNFGGGLELSVALEEAGNTSDAGGPGINACTRSGAFCTPLSSSEFNTMSGFVGPQRWPNVTAALQWNFPNGVIYASGMVGQLYVDSGGIAQLSRHDSAFRWGAALAGRYRFARVEIGGAGGVGQGIGRKYFDESVTGFRDAVLIVSGNMADLRPVLVYSVLGYAQAKLTDTIRTTGAFSWGMNEMASEVPSYYAAGSTSRGTLTAVSNWYMSAHANILWDPVPQVTFGAEYSYQFASRYNAANTMVQRLQFSAIYRF